MHTGVSTKVPGTRHTRVWLGGHISLSTLLTGVAILWTILVYGIIYLTKPLPPQRTRDDK